MAAYKSPSHSSSNHRIDEYTCTYMQREGTDKEGGRANERVEEKEGRRGERERERDASTTYIDTEVV